eukprot:5895458-Pleurochrysis_carterae.AAC.1
MVVTTLLGKRAAVNPWNIAVSCRLTMHLLIRAWLRETLRLVRGRNEQSTGLGVGEDRDRGQGSRTCAGLQKELIHPTHEREAFVPWGSSRIGTISTIPRTISLHPVRIGWWLRLAGDNDDDPRFRTGAWNLNQFP